MFNDFKALQKQLPKLQKTGINPHFNNKYIPLEELVSAILPLLHEYNFVLTQQPTLEGLYTALWHESGDKIEFTMALGLGDAYNPQQQGSAITYARRYSLMAVLGLVADTDDDGNTAKDAQTVTTNYAVSDAQKGLLTKLLAEKIPDGFHVAYVRGVIGKDKVGTKSEASQVIEALMKEPNAQA